MLNNIPPWQLVLSKELDLYEQGIQTEGTMHNEAVCEHIRAAASSYTSQYMSQPFIMIHTHFPPKHLISL